MIRWYYLAPWHAEEFSMVSWKQSVLVFSIAAFGVAVPFFHSSPALAVPAPSVLPVSWELDFENHLPERLVMFSDKGERQVFWYMRYKVTNNTKQDQLFTPDFQLITNTGQIIDAGVDANNKPLPPAIFDKIKALYRNNLMESPIEVLGRLKQGDDNAKESVAIFAGVDFGARKFRIVTTGLYGETKQVQNPLTNKPEVLRKALVLDFDVPGEANGIPPAPTLVDKSFVMK